MLIIKPVAGHSSWNSELQVHHEILPQNVKWKVMDPRPLLPSTVHTWAVTPTNAHMWRHIQISKQQIKFKVGAVAGLGGTHI